jgi:F0F1-type ATP synthase membrane subunit b/b'
VASAKEKQIRTRLEQIKERASQLAANKDDKVAANLAEEACDLALQLYEEAKN